MANYSLGNLVWKITGDASALNSELAQVQAKVKQTDSAVNKSSLSMSTALKAIGGSAVIAGLGMLTKKLVGMASDAEETATKFGVVFAGSIDAANAAVKELTASYGLSSTEARKMLADTGDLFQGFGFAEKDSLKLSNSLAKLAVDLASFQNYAGGSAGAMEALRKAMIGETEMAKSLGIAIDQSSKEFNALVAAKMKDKNVTERQAKSLVIYDEILRQTANAQGDFGRTSGGFANQMRILESKMKDVGESIGNVMLPAFTLLLKTLNNSDESGGIFIDMMKKIAGIIAIGVYDISSFIESLELIALNVKLAKTQIDLFATDSSSEKYQELVNLEKKYKEAISATEFKMLEITELQRIQYAVVAGTTDAIWAEVDGVNTLKHHVKDGVLLVQNFEKVNNNITAGTKKQLGVRKDITVETDKQLRKMMELQKQAERLEVSGTWGEGLKKDLGIAGEFDKELSADLQNSINKNLGIAGAGGKEIGQEFTAGISEGFKGIDQEILKAVKDAMTEIQKLSDAGFSQITGLLGALSQYSKTQTDNRVADLERQMEAELEAAGLSEETAVEKAQKELEIAKEKGVQEDILEKEKALKKAQIEEDFNKKIKQAEYEGSLTAWEFQRAIALVEMIRTPLSAYLAGLNSTGNVYAAAAIAAASAITAGIQYAAVVNAKPQKPKFAEGGIVPGSMFSGDQVTAQVNSGEMVLNKDQQLELFNIAKGGGGASGLYRVVGDTNFMWDDIYKASKDGRLYISDKAVVTR